MRLLCLALLLAAALSAPVLQPRAAEAPTPASVLAASAAGDWRTLPQADLLYLFLDAGVVIAEVARDFAPAHLANLEKLAADGYFDGLAIVRAQDNYVVQWGDPDAGEAGARSLGDAAATLTPEFDRPLAGLDFDVLDSRDPYADRVGFVAGMPVGSDGERAWLAHCYGMLGAGRAEAPESGNAAELYAVIGHAPRHLDRNVTLLGRVLQGIELLSTLPRGTGPLSFYETGAEHVPIRRLRFGDQLPAGDQVHLERLRTGTATFDRLVEALRYRADDWFVHRAGRIGLCNVTPPVRPAT